MQLQDEIDMSSVQRAYQLSSMQMITCDRSAALSSLAASAASKRNFFAGLSRGLSTFYGARNTFVAQSSPGPPLEIGGLGASLQGPGSVPRPSRALGLLLQAASFCRSNRRLPPSALHLSRLFALGSVPGLCW